MLICHCTLPYTNPDACKNCKTYLDYYKENTFPSDDIQIPYYPYPLSPSPKKIKKVTKKIKKYDSEGKFIGEEIIEETIEKIENPGYTFSVSSAIDYDPDDNKSSGITGHSFTNTSVSESKYQFSPNKRDFRMDPASSLMYIRGEESDLPKDNIEYLE